MAAISPELAVFSRYLVHCFVSVNFPTQQTIFVNDKWILSRIETEFKFLIDFTFYAMETCDAMVGVCSFCRCSCFIANICSLFSPKFNLVEFFLSVFVFYIDCCCDDVSRRFLWFWREFLCLTLWEQKQKSITWKWFWRATQNQNQQIGIRRFVARGDGGTFALFSFIYSCIW